MNAVTEQVLSMLRESRDFLSGEQISRRLGMSRAAVWKHITQLRQAGYGIESVRNRGYRLGATPDTPLDLEIRAHLHTRYLGQELVYLPTTGSTNTVAGTLAKQGAADGTVVIADTQESGRGRLARSWFSPAGRNIYLSVILRPAVVPHQVPQLSLVAGVALVRAIDRLVPGLDLGLKWPNDVFVGRRKVCGILCDMQSEMDRVHHLVLGIGINVNLKSGEFSPEIADKATSLAIEAGRDLSRPRLVAALLEELEAAYEAWLVQGLDSLQADWDRFSILKGNTITVETAAGTISGQAMGISKRGFLMMRTPDGREQEILSGDVHVAKF